MSKYTTEVRYICETAAGLEQSAGYASVNDILDLANTKIFDFDYPIFDESYREPLQKKILKHFYTREIGAETVGLWKLWLDQRMNEIMPFYNKLYESELYKFNPLYDTDLTREHQTIFAGNTDGTRETKENEQVDEDKHGNIVTTLDSDGATTNTENRNLAHDQADTSTTTTEVSDDSEGWNKFSDTPQGGVTGLAADNYLSNATHTTDERTTDTDTDYSAESHSTGSDRLSASGTNTLDSEEERTSEENNNIHRIKSGNEDTTTRIRNTEDYLEHVTGKQGGMSYSKMLLEFRDTFLNIDMEIINNLNDLFLNLW